MQPEKETARWTRRGFLRASMAFAVPAIIPASALGADGRPAPSERITMGAIGTGGRGTGDMKGFLGFPEVQVVAVCDVRKDRREAARDAVNKYYGNQSCAAPVDFREIIARDDIDTVMIGTPDHWHAVMSIEAMRAGKDVFCEKPETLTISQGREMAEATARYARVFCGGSQRVWGDFNWFHRMVRGGAIGELQEVWVNVGGPSKPCTLPGQPVPPDLDWDLWLGPVPWAPFNPGRLGFRAWQDYSGGGMTDWGAHVFGGALFAAGLHLTGPVEIIPPDGKEHEFLTYRFANGVRFYHAPNKVDGRLRFKGTRGDIVQNDSRRLTAPDIDIPNYKGTGGLPGDFIHCVRTREKPFRNIEAAHRAVTVCHLGNLAYWLNRPLKWDPNKEEIVGDEVANRWLSRPMRAPWRLA